MQAPLPLALRTGLAWVQDGNAAQVYEGGWNSEGENTDPCLARIYPDFEALSADGRMAALAQLVCAPLAEWASGRVRATPHAPAPAPEAAAEPEKMDTA